MSVEQAKAFIEKMKADEVFRVQIMAIETSEGRVKAIKEAGFECTAEEINDVGSSGDEVVGGVCTVYSPGLKQAGYSGFGGRC